MLPPGVRPRTEPHLAPEGTSPGPEQGRSGRQALRNTRRRGLRDVFCCQCADQSSSPRLPYARMRTPWDREVFRQNRPFLQSNMTPATVRMWCAASGLLLDTQKQTLAAITDRNTHNEKLLEMVSGGDAESFHIFCEVLREKEPKFTFSRVLKEFSKIDPFASGDELFRDEPLAAGGEAVLRTSEIPSPALHVAENQHHQDIASTAEDVNGEIRDVLEEIENLEQIACSAAKVKCKLFDSSYQPIACEEVVSEALRSATCLIMIDEAFSRQLDDDPPNAIVTLLTEANIDPEKCTTKVLEFRKAKVVSVREPNRQRWKASRVLVRISLAISLDDEHLEVSQNVIKKSLEGYVDGDEIKVRARRRGCVILVVDMSASAVTKLYNITAEQPGLLAGLGVLEIGCLGRSAQIDVQACNKAASQDTRDPNEHAKTSELAEKLSAVLSEEVRSEVAAKTNFNAAVEMAVRAAYPEVDVIRRIHVAAQEISLSTVAGTICMEPALIGKMGFSYDEVIRALHNAHFNTRNFKLVRASSDDEEPFTADDPEVQVAVSKESVSPLVTAVIDMDRSNPRYSLVRNKLWHALGNAIGGGDRQVRVCSKRIRQ